MFGRRRTSRAQGRRDREWRRFVRDLTEPARQVSPAEDARMQSFLDSEAVRQAREAQRQAGSGPPAERAA
jgi:hypothetical protein